MKDVKYNIQLTSVDSTITWAITTAEYVLTTQFTLIQGNRSGGVSGTFQTGWKIEGYAA